jgi:hypothetical protein
MIYWDGTRNIAKCPTVYPHVLSDALLARLRFGHVCVCLCVCVRSRLALAAFSKPVAGAGNRQTALSSIPVTEMAFQNFITPRHTVERQGGTVLGAMQDYVSSWKDGTLHFHICAVLVTTANFDKTAVRYGHYGYRKCFCHMDKKDRKKNPLY